MFEHHQFLGISSWRGSGRREPAPAGTGSSERPGVCGARSLAARGAGPGSVCSACEGSFGSCENALQETSPCRERSPFQQGSRFFFFFSPHLEKKQELWGPSRPCCWMGSRAVPTRLQPWPRFCSYCGFRECWQ